MGDIEERLKKLGLSLPGPFKAPPPPPVIDFPFAWARVHGGRVYLSAHGAQNPDGTLAPPFGKVGEDVNIERAQQSVRLATLALLGSLKRAFALVQRVTGASTTDLVEHRGGDVVMVGDIPIELIHTPGHTPGSQCFFVDQRLVAGDTLFLEGCGRTDLPGGDPRALYQSLTQTLSKIPDDAILFPGHLYSEDPSASMGDTRRLNFVFRPKDEHQWLQMFGAG